MYSRSIQRVLTATELITFVITEERKEIMSEQNKPATIPSVDDVVRRPLCECGGRTSYFGEALMGSLRCEKCDQWLAGVGDEFIGTINQRWIRGERGYAKN